MWMSRAGSFCKVKLWICLSSLSVPTLNFALFTTNHTKSKPPFPLHGLESQNTLASFVGYKNKGPTKPVLSTLLA
ncbi:hypothetical protein BJ878DRAFT_155627 [Calycina marina]|uniref:Uncharacterized protein n=1 Tax=Calycina marina TaxID=1763456 RepID=A0A9P8CDH0_9HELO|nr:hypothetical protein BJ878DRAFT_155627 [Calycina marina]